MLQSIKNQILFPFLLIFLGFGGIKDQPFWSVMLELGGRGKKQEAHAYEVLDQFLQYTKASLYNTHLSPEAKAYQMLYDDRMATLDIEDMYQVLPFEMDNLPWKGSHHLETYKKGKILRYLDDPDIEKWLSSKDHERFAPWKKLSFLGESDERFYVRPIAGNGGVNHFLAYYFERMALGKLNPNTIIYGLTSLLSLMEKGVRDLPEDFEPTEEMENQFPYLSPGEYFLLHTFSKDMPSMYQKITRYVNIKGISTPMEYKNKEYCQFNLHLSLNMKGIQKDFPHLYAYLRRIKGLIDLKSRMYNDKGQYVGFIRFTTTSFTFHFSYCMHKGRFLPSSNWIPYNFKGFSPLDMGSQHYTFRNDVRININGIRIVLRNIVLEETYSHTPTLTKLHLKMTKAPIIQKLDGRAYGVVPIWLIDLLIPSNVEDLLKNFFKVLVKGRKGKGWFLEIRTYAKPGKNRIELAVGSELLSNGVIKMALKIASDLLIPDKKASQDLVRFGKLFWHAFYSDYISFRYR
ncbi:MAG: hypothetical protein D6785_09430 [Planctomycetota bacterium]|nr:MAG: hypothetical protein D6785_09430 [Planctomycetota bacterium]